MRSILSVPGILALALPGCLTSAEARDTAAARDATELRLGPVRIHPVLDDRGREVPGTLVFDTTGGRLDLSALIPDKPREFATREAFHAWAVANLNARIVAREGAEPVTQLEVTASTTLRYDRELDDLVPVDDPIEAIVGGDAGYVVIAGERACVSRSAPCARGSGLAPVESRDRAWLVTGTTGSFGTLATSWIARDWWYESIGSSTAQWDATTGQVWKWTSCGWSCWTLAVRGSSFLTTSFAAFAGRSLRSSHAASAANTLGVIASRVTFGFRPATATTTCGSHFGASGPDALFLSSGMGNC